MVKNISRNSLVLCTVSIVALLYHDESFANPQNGTVVAGAATIDAGNKKLDIYQSSDKAVIDWRSFSIDVDEHTQFHQPSNAATTLNRVKGSDPSKIMGKLTANGNVVLVNPNGVLFGKSAKVDVNGLIATTSDIGNDDFMAGRMRFAKPGAPDSSVVNEGTITAKEAGLVGLVAPNVINRGVIEAKLGRVELASGDRMTVDLYGDGLYEVSVSDEVKSQLVANSGSIRADGGTIAITAVAGKKIVNSLIAIEGELRAPSVKEKDGKIIIAAEGNNAVKANSATDKGAKQGKSTVMLSGAYLDASGRKTGARGGSIEITGDEIALLKQSVVDASGNAANKMSVSPQHASAALTAERMVRSEAEFLKQESRGGGSIKIGGDYLGKGETPAAKNVYVDSSSLILNDAVDYGDGGRTIVWADDTTAYYGNAFARGGIDGGNGGFLETSGKRYLDAQGTADLSAAEGFRKGLYLLDPTNIAIYGFVTPNFVSTDNSINLASGQALWLDATDTAKVELTYSNSALGAATASGGAGGTTFTTSANLSGVLKVGSRIRLGGAGAVTTASIKGNDTFTITAIAGTTVTVAETLAAPYVNQPIYQGLVSSWMDKSPTPKNATQGSDTVMPVWLSNSGINNFSSVDFNNGLNYLTLGNNFIFSTAADGGISLFAAIQALTNATGGTTEFIMDFGNWGSDGYGFMLNKDRVLMYTPSGFGGAQINVAHTKGNNPVIYRSVVKFADAERIWLNGEVTGTALIPTLTKITSVEVNANMNRSGGSGPVTIGTTSKTLNESLRDFEGWMGELLLYTRARGVDEADLLEQYQTVKWNTAFLPHGTGATEAARAMSATGISAFTTRYLERLATTTDILLQADNNITLDLQGDALTLADNRNITLQTTAGNISTASAGSIVTNHNASGGNIIFTAGTAGNIAIDHALTLNAQNGGAITFNAAGGAVNVGAGGNLTVTQNNLTINSPGFSNAGTISGNVVWNSDTFTSGTFTGTGAGITVQQNTAGNTLGVGAGGTPNVSLSNALITQIKNGFSSYVFGRTNGGALTNYTAAWDDPVTFLTGGDFTNAVATTSASSILSRAGGKVILNAGMSTSSASANALVLSAGDDFINNAGANALAAPSSRWLVYSDEPADNKRDGLMPVASEFGKSYLANLPATIGAGNRFVYATAVRPTLTYDINADTVVAGYTYNGFGITYNSGAVGDDTGLNVGVAGTPAYSTTYTSSDPLGTYVGALNAVTGTMNTPLGYQFAFNPGTLTVTPYVSGGGGGGGANVPVMPVTPPISTPVPSVPPATNVPTPSRPSAAAIDAINGLPSTVEFTSQIPIIANSPINRSIMESGRSGATFAGYTEVSGTERTEISADTAIPASSQHLRRYKKALGGLVEIHPSLMRILGLSEDKRTF